MIEVRHHPELVTPELLAWLRPHVRYDAEGLASKFLVEDEPLWPWRLRDIAQAVCPGKDFRAVILRGYKDGRAETPCHSDKGATGFCMILSLGATRTFRTHRVRFSQQVKHLCEDQRLDQVDIPCPSGTVLLMEEAFHEMHHHQVIADPDVQDERLSLVFRATPAWMA